MKKFFLLIVFLVTIIPFSQILAQIPSSFDLRDVGGSNYVTSVKSQTGGTCWTHGSMAAMEGNLLMNGNWVSAGESGEPNLAEYHLDWWNGFNQHNNDDISPPSGSGLEVHQGGDYLVTAAYLSRGEGAVRDIDGQSYSTPPLRFDISFHYYYPRDIEWYIMDKDLNGIDLIKEKVMSEGVMGTCLCSNALFMSNYIHYQPPTNALDPNHAVSIVGWDDDKPTQAPLPGAWLCKNSWGESWGESGYFWISYYDKHSCRHPEMGAVSFQNVEPLQYDHIYYHDYHGWRNTKTDITEAFNALYADGNQKIEAVSFYTADDNVDYTVTIYDRYESGQLLDELTSKSGNIQYHGFHTIDLDNPIDMLELNDFYVYIELSDGGHAYDMTSDIPVLLGAKYRTIVESSSQPGQSFYKEGEVWYDLFDLESSANFCIKALARDYKYLDINLPNGNPDYIDPYTTSSFEVQINDGDDTYLVGSGKLYYRFNEDVFLESTLTSLGGNSFEATLPGTGCYSSPEYYIEAETIGGHTVIYPDNAPTAVFVSIIGNPVITMEDNFETDQGWTTQSLGATSGFWQRGVPVNDPGWDYDPLEDGDGSGQCYLTENTPGNTDVDGGSVTLISPIFEMTDGRQIEYDYYLYLTSYEGGVDKLLVEINSEGGTGLWTEIARHDTHGEYLWRHHVIGEEELIAAGIEFNSTVQIRFTANDSDPGSIVEAGIDGFMVTYIDCESFLCGDVDGDELVNILDIVYLINYKYKDGPEPLCLPVVICADVNSDDLVNILDIVYLINYKYKDGPEPVCP